MDQGKIGKFICLKREEKKLTQEKLAEKLNITDRAVSKWERGLSMPDAATIPVLCDILGITINDLFSGQVVDMKDNEKKLAENLLEMKKKKEEKDKQLLQLEIIIGIISTCALLFIISLVNFIDLDDSVKLLIIIPSIIFYLFMGLVLIFIEQVAGYYECSHCHHKYIPTYINVFKAIHFGRTRYMKCPKCTNRTWHKKIIK